MAARAAAYQAELAAGPQYGGGEEAWGEEEWYEEEEGGYEEAAYHPGSKPAGEESHLEEGLLVQPLPESPAETAAKAVAVVRLCQDTRHEVSKTGPCARYAGFLHWLKQRAGGAWHALKGAAHLVGVSLLHTFHSLGAADAVCHGVERCLAPVMTLYDGYQCFDASDCQAFSQDLSEYF